MKCPECGKDVSQDSPYKPFCSDKCKLVDLDKWLVGDYVFPGDEPAPPEEDPH